MKARKVILTIKVLTDMPLKQLKDSQCMQLSYYPRNGYLDYVPDIDILQIQANIVKKGDK